MITSSRFMPIASIILVNNCPARPTNGLPWASSSAPGASPTNIRRAFPFPCVFTTWVRPSHKPQRVQSPISCQICSNVAGNVSAARSPNNDSACPAGLVVVNGLRGSASNTGCGIETGAAARSISGVVIESGALARSSERFSTPSSRKNFACSRALCSTSINSLVRSRGILWLSVLRTLCGQYLSAEACDLVEDSIGHLELRGGRHLDGLRPVFYQDCDCVTR